MGLFNFFKKKPDEEKNDIVLSESNDEKVDKTETSLLEMSDYILTETRENLDNSHTSIPIAGLAALGSCVSSLIPTINTITKTTTLNTGGLYRLANTTLGDTLKSAKDGTFWGAFKTMGGKSKMLKISQVDSVSFTTTTIMPINPATVMMAAALSAIEQKIDDILEIEKEILSFLEKDKESEIEADLKTLMNIVQEYKYNWDNEQYVSSHHKLALDIKRTAEKNLTFYQNQIAEDLKEKKLVNFTQSVDSAEMNLQKKFKYYRLSLYIYSFASFLEVMLLGNFKEEYILQVKDVVKKYSDEYNQNYLSADEYVGKIANSSIDANIVNGLGVAGRAIGNFIGNIPLIKEGPVDEWFNGIGTNLKNKSKDMKQQPSEKLGTIQNTGSDIFLEKFDQMNKIYNYTTGICFDDERIFLLNENKDSKGDL